ncbi:FYVE and coiled-coil domain-containing protein 1, partial [Patella vulgata]|uniref:FYVE and coiled-coil domain-containing protein 1 n=1 Tax=Patella vulgata TaxID=6465 RepID=UPI0021805566
MSKVVTAASLSTGPQQEKIIQDVEECVKLLVEIFQESRTPINDDDQTLQRFCAKLEHLFQMDMKEKYSLLGRRKDYWDYFCDCLSSNKGSNDGIKFVKSLGGEHKTSLGKGRALIRFCLVHNRLPDSIQQCVINGKVTSDYFFPQSIWLKKEKSSTIISCLYDLNEVNFDLSSRGYDLDSAWPSFAKKSGGSFSWNPPSRRSSISSMASVQTTDNTSVLNMSIPTFDSHEVDRLNQDLAYSESLQSELKGKVESLQEEKFLSDKSAWVTQGELMAVQNQLQDSQEQLVKLQEDYVYNPKI